MAYTGGNAGYVRRLGKIFSTADPLLTSLKAYWKLDETSGNRSDSIGVYTLTDNNTVGSTTGKIGNAASMLATNSEYLSLLGASMNAMLPLATSWSFSGWFRNPNGGSTLPFSWNINSGGYEQRMRWYWYGGVAPGTGGEGWTVDIEQGQIIIPGYHDTSAWTFVAATYDVDLQKAVVQINGASDVEDATAAPVAATGAPCPFTIPYSASFTDLQADEVAFWGRVLSRAERDRIYNSGAGLSLV